MAEPMVEKVVAELRSLGATVATGRFGAYMSISQICDGPTTILIEV
jgi:D-tyrosyl-tRNA(Tyr) deacylase